MRREGERGDEQASRVHGTQLMDLSDDCLIAILRRLDEGPTGPGWRPVSPSPDLHPNRALRCAVVCKRLCAIVNETVTHVRVDVKPGCSFRRIKGPFLQQLRQFTFLESLVLQSFHLANWDSLIHTLATSCPLLMTLILSKSRTKIHPSLLRSLNTLCPNLKVLLFDDVMPNNLLELPEELFQSVSLRHLSLTRCLSIERFDDPTSTWQTALPSLTTLELKTMPHLLSLPLAIGDLSALRRLSLSGLHSLKALPQSLGNLSQLQSLSIDNCWALTLLPEALGNLALLQELSISHCKQLLVLHESLSKLPDLRHLSFSYCEILSFLPKSIGNLTSLKRLDIVDCPLHNLPASIGKLTALRSLCLRKCSRLKGLPDKIEGLMSLRAIDLSNCFNITTLPNDIGRLMNLRFLSLHNCENLTSLPDSLQNLRLDVLEHEGCRRLDRMDIVVAPQKMPSQERVTNIPLWLRG